MNHYARPYWYRVCEMDDRWLLAIAAVWLIFIGFFA